MKNNEDDFKYTVMYSTELGEWTRQEVEDRVGANKNTGACSELGLLSVILPPDGSYSLLPIGVTADGKDWDGLRWFKVWTLLASKLADDKSLTIEKRFLAASTFDAFLTGRGLPARKLAELLAEQSAKDATPSAEASAEHKGGRDDLN